MVESTERNKKEVKRLQQWAQTLFPLRRTESEGMLLNLWLSVTRAGGVTANAVRGQRRQNKRNMTSTAGLFFVWTVTFTPPCLFFVEIE